MQQQQLHNPSAHPRALAQLHMNRALAQQWTDKPGLRELYLAEARRWAIIAKAIRQEQHQPQEHQHHV